MGKLKKSPKFKSEKEESESRHTDDSSKGTHRIYIQVLRQMSSKKRLLRAFELSEFANQLFIHGLRKRFPSLSEEEFKKILLERLHKCHNRNY